MKEIKMPFEHAGGDGPRHVHNQRSQDHLKDDAARLFDLEAIEEAHKEIASWPGYRPTPLVNLPGLAREAGVGAVYYKDEGQRFDLASFKALGGAYAVLCVLKNKLRAMGITATASDLIAGRFGALVNDETVVCATDGNHGRSVAWGASMFGCNCRIYIHENVSEDRESAIAEFGAQMVRTNGDYDESVRACARDAEQNGWTLVADTNAGGGAPDVPILVMQGYTLMVGELMDQLHDTPTHLLMPAGVGGLVAAVAGYWTKLHGRARPRMIAVEPHNANCVYRAIENGKPRALDGDTNSFMACLAAGQVSPVAWPILETVVDDVLTISDEAAMATMRALAIGEFGDQAIVSGESGCASVAALLAIHNNDRLRAALSIDRNSKILAIGSEGATAPVIWEKVVGKSPASIAAIA